MMWLFLLLIVVAGVAIVVSTRRNRERLAELKAQELAPVAKLAFEDVTALGAELQALDSELAGVELDEGTRADYQRALDAYESAKTAGDQITEPEHIRHVTEILDDGRYAITCVRARVAGEALPTRRPPCFFDARHGLSVTDVDYAPPGGTMRPVPACALDAERVAAGADPDIRQVMVGSQRMPYWQGGPAYEPYAAGYYGGFMPMNLLFAGMLIGGMGGFGWGGALAGDEGSGDSGDSGGDSGGGDYGGGDHGGGGFGGGDFGAGGFGGGDFGGGF